MMSLFERLPEAIAEPEIVRWLREAAPAARAIPRPGNGDLTRAYTRTLIHRSPEFEILVLHWSPGSLTAIHDHGGAQCWFAVAAGTVRVDNYRRCDSGATPGYARITADGEAMLPKGAIDYRQDDVHLHRCGAGQAEAVTVHVYAHPLERFNTFDDRRNCCFEVAPTYDAIWKTTA